MDVPQNKLLALTQGFAAWGGLQNKTLDLAADPRLQPLLDLGLELLTELYDAAVRHDFQTVETNDYARLQGRLRQALRLTNRDVTLPPAARFVRNVLGVHLADVEDVYKIEHPDVAWSPMTPTDVRVAFTGDDAKTNTELVRGFMAVCAEHGVPAQVQPRGANLTQANRHPTLWPWVKFMAVASMDEMVTAHG